MESIGSVVLSIVCVGDRGYAMKWLCDWVSRKHGCLYSSINANRSTTDRFDSREFIR